MITKTPTENIVGVFVNLNDKLGFIGEFEKLVCVQKGELPQSTSLTAPCRREPQSYFDLNGKIPLFCNNGINFTNFFRCKTNISLPTTGRWQNRRF